MNTRLADQICDAASMLTDQYAREAIDYIEFLLINNERRDDPENDLIQAQAFSMRHVWEGEEDEVWNDVEPL